jgi:hypothetical protein
MRPLLKHVVPELVELGHADRERGVQTVTLMRRWYVHTCTFRVVDLVMSREYMPTLELRIQLIDGPYNYINHLNGHCQIRSIEQRRYMQC